jgi:hypothetical protein
MFFGERTLSTSLLIFFFAAYFTSLLIFLVPARRRTSKFQLLKKLQKALTSDLIINVNLLRSCRYRMRLISLVSSQTFIESCDQLTASTASVCDELLNRREV